MASIEVERILGCVVYPAAEIASPGVIKLIEGNRFPVGELDGSESERVKNITATFAKAGFESPVLKDIRSEIWLKLSGNLSFNPISALTHSTLVDIRQFPLTRHRRRHDDRGADYRATSSASNFRVSLEKRIAGAEKVGKHKTSMLQDMRSAAPSRSTPSSAP